MPATSDTPAIQHPNFNWKVAALGVLAIALTLAVSPMGWEKLAVSLIAITLLAFAQRWPIAMGIALTMMFILASAAESIRSPVFLLSAPFLVAFVALAGHPRAAAVFAVIMGYISSTSPSTGRWLPNDYTGVAIFAALLAVGWWAGVHVRRQRLQHAANEKRLREDMEERRERLAQALHDSVATTLTSVVMRAETLALTSRDDDAARETAEHIADETRQAMQEVRHLLHFMRDDTGVAAAPINRTIAEQVSVTSRLLISHGFSVVSNKDEDDSLITSGESFPAGFEQVFAELSTNAIKYAVPGSEIRLEVRKTDSGLKCLMSNEVRPSPVSSIMSSSLGLRETRSLVSHSSGQFHTGRQGNRWIAEFELPDHALRH